jgi:hypothetical protein
MTTDMTFYHDDPTIADVKAEWRDRADCSAVVADEPLMAEAWIQQHNLFSERARMICEDCPVRMACLHDALNDRHVEGMRGGFFFDNGLLESGEAAMMYRELRLRVRSRRTRRTGRAQKIA